MKIFENVKVVSTILPITAAAGATNGVAVDTEGYGDGMIVVSVGAATGTPDSFTVAAKVQESADGSTNWTDISGSAIATVTAASKTGEIALALNSRAAAMRYVRVVATPAFVNGTSPKIAIGAVVLLGSPEIVSTALNSTTAN